MLSETYNIKCVFAEGEKLSAEGAEGSERGANYTAGRFGEIQGM